METTVESVLPVFGLVLCGYLVGRSRLLTVEGVTGLTRFVFYVAIPVLLFRTISRNELPDWSDLSVLFAYYGGCFGLFLLACVIGRLLFALPMDQLGIFAIGSVYANTVLLGLPLMLAVHGEAGLLPILLIISFHNTLLLPWTTVVIEIGRGQPGQWGHVLGSSLKALVTNPVVIALAFGLIVAALRLGLPKPADRMAELLGAAAAPCALFALGASLAGYRIAGRLSESMTIVALRLVAHPVIVWFLARYLFELDPLWTAVATLTAALPTGANVFVLSQSYGLYVARATSATLISTGLSIFTVAALLDVLPR